MECEDNLIEIYLTHTEIHEGLQFGECHAI